MKSSSYCCTALGSSPQPQPVLVSRVSYSVLHLSIPCCSINSSTFALIPVWRHTLCLGDISQCLQTCVVHHQDLPGPLTGGEQPHLRRILHQLRGKYCVFKVGLTQCGESHRSLQISWLPVKLLSDENWCWTRPFSNLMEDKSIYRGNIDEFNMWILKMNQRAIPNLENYVCLLVK